ncbi:hypothetical protein HYPSUDRAFT_200285 [Hypholoma sublateritium FD-334 SS-4]|uniref:Uncharacterized protein n=1 Tax=Hypholoma sublateritium (strain FD-334 SS-4) TaxID=945553 RepID=A0A0D2P7X2_HYPSF|nr:hypothetical protein HYPSUDRAFT_200285 [Hypholoma sublateritium FD-334 SS-4]
MEHLIIFRKSPWAALGVLFGVPGSAGRSGPPAPSACVLPCLCTPGVPAPPRFRGHSTIPVPPAHVRREFRSPIPQAFQPPLTRPSGVPVLPQASPPLCTLGVPVAPAFALGQFQPFAPCAY